jgi:predicted lipoprotein with Yx(FWY)xxD motif
VVGGDRREVLDERAAAGGVPGQADLVGRYVADVDIGNARAGASSSPAASGSPASSGGAAVAAANTVRTAQIGGATVLTSSTGHPMYTFVGDTSPGQANGNGLNAAGGVWDGRDDTTGVRAAGGGGKVS